MNGPADERKGHARSKNRLGARVTRSVVSTSAWPRGADHGSDRCGVTPYLWGLTLGIRFFNMYVL